MLIEHFRTFKLPAMLIGVDVSRHKEIATKAISGIAFFYKVFNEMFY